MKLFKKIRIILGFFILGTVLTFSCSDGLDLAKPEISAAQIMSADKDFNDYLSKIMELTSRVKSSENLLLIGFKKSKLIELSKIANPTEKDIEEISKLYNFKNSAEFNVFLSDLNAKAKVVAKKFPEMNSLKISDVETIVNNSTTIARMNRNAKTYTCKKGYATCLIKTYAAGAAGVIGCSALGPLGLPCAAAVAIATIAGYEECAINFCGSGIFEE